MIEKAAICLNCAVLFYWDTNVGCPGCHSSDFVKMDKAASALAAAAIKVGKEKGFFEI